MLAPIHIVHDSAYLLADVRWLLGSWPALSAYPERLAAMLGADEYDVRAALEALEVDSEVLP